MRSEESRKRSSDAAKRAWANPEIRKRQSEACKEARNRPETNAKLHLALYGKKRSPEACDNIRRGSIIGKSSPEVREKLSDAAKKLWKDPAHRKRMSDAHKGKAVPKAIAALKVINDSRKGMKRPHEICERISAGKLKRLGGISFLPYCPKFNENLKHRVREFFENRCVMCGKHQAECNRKHAVHHISYDKMVCCNDMPVYFAALCTSCHSKTNNKDRQRWENMLHRCIDEIWNGKSYLTKEEHALMRVS